MSDGLSRRSFIKLAATAGAAAAIPGCEPAARHLIPYVVPDENVIPGMPSFYASVCGECSAGCGIVGRVREGRVIKLEGNPLDPISDGSICARGQASLQGLYNPDRLPHPKHRTAAGVFEAVDWETAIKLFNQPLAAAAKAGKNRVALIAGPLGPTQTKIARMWLAAYGSDRMVTYERLDERAAHVAAKSCFGRDDLPVYRIDKAEALISFGADFAATWGSPVEYARQYATFRKPRMRRGRLSLARATYVGPRMGITAGKCDEWVATVPGTEAAIAMSVLNVLINQGWVSVTSGVNLDALRQFVAGHEPEAVAKKTGISPDSITRMGESFGQAESAVALAGGDDPELHTAVFILNAVTGNIGKTVVFEDNGPSAAVSSPADVENLIKAMTGGEVDALVIAGAGNPAFSLPPSTKFAEAVKKVGFVAWLGDVPDESATLAHLQLPIDHPLETWRDTHPRAGIWGLGQPVTARIFDSRPLGDILLDSARAGGATSKEAPWENTADAVNAAWQDLAKTSGATSFPEFWQKVRRHGGLFEEATVATVTLNPVVLQSPPQAPAVGSDLALFAYPHIFFYDGRGADKPWLQEIPEPVTQIVWDGWVEMHPNTARKLGVSRNGIVELRSSEGTVRLSAHLSEYVREGVLAAPIGQGHTAYGRYANGRGGNVWSMLPMAARSVTVKARPTGDVHQLVSPIGVSYQMGRGIVQATSVEDLAKGITPPPLGPKVPAPYQLYPPFQYPGHKWGMTIDVNACTGCSACVAACYAENNLAVVGKTQVAKGRVMSWLRTERYFPAKDQTEGPLLYVEPMLCQQCDQAPCEPVCPVFASAHTDQGLNQQIYNRCIGTRYCENNCPYKVRRFNWYAPEWDPPLNLQLNPDVTVRGAGVMEKCTFCIQRIVFHELNAMIEKRPLRDGEIQPACVEACPSKAMTFGDENDPQSAMMRRRDEHAIRRYRVLHDLDVGPNIVYLRDIYQGKGKA